MKILFIDKNRSLVNKVKKAIEYFPKSNISAKYGNIFKEEGVIVSASNPDFSCGGGLDRQIVLQGNKPPKVPNKNIRIKKVIWTITVDKDIKSSRKLVVSALKFALKNTKDTETVLISGLGTGIGELHEDDFVWLFLQAISEHFKYGWGIKFANKGYKSFTAHSVTKKYINYKVGETIELKDAPKNGQECATGMHLGRDFAGAGNYHVPKKILFCIFDKKDICGRGNDKIRVRKLLVLAELPLWTGYGPKGYNVVPKLGKKVNVEKYNPYQTSELPTKEVLKPFIKKMSFVRAQVGDQVWDQVRAQVRAQVWDQLWDQVGDQVRAQVGAQVRAQVGDQVWDQVWDQVGATSYWAVNIHFDLGISHWFGDLLKLGVMIIFVQGKVKIFGKKGKYLGEYNESEFK